MKYVYPVIFSKEDDGSFCVYVPDLPGCVTEAESYADGIDKIREGICGVLYIMERDKMPIPTPSSPGELVVGPSEVVSLVDADVNEYRRRIGSRAVRRTVSIPEWMDEKAAEKGLSLSSVLQEGLKSYLHI